MSAVSSFPIGCPWSFPVGCSWSFPVGCSWSFAFTFGCLCSFPVLCQWSFQVLLDVHDHLISVHDHFISSCLWIFDSFFLLLEMPFSANHFLLNIFLLEHILVHCIHVFKRKNGIFLFVCGVQIDHLPVILRAYRFFAHSLVADWVCFPCLSSRFFCLSVIQEPGAGILYHLPKPCTSDVWGNQGITCYELLSHQKQLYWDLTQWYIAHLRLGDFGTVYVI